MLFFLLIDIKMPTIVGIITSSFVVCCSCACLMRPTSQGTKRYQAHYLSMCCVFVRMYSFAGLIRWTPPPTFSDTAITDRHSDTTFSSSEHTGCGYPSLLDRKYLSVEAAGGCRTLDFFGERRTPYLLGQALCTFMSRKKFMLS